MHKDLAHAKDGASYSCCWRQFRQLLFRSRRSHPRWLALHCRPSTSKPIPKLSATGL